jgi:hypothetical protein
MFWGPKSSVDRHFCEWCGKSAPRGTVLSIDYSGKEYPVRFCSDTCQSDYFKSFEKAKRNEPRMKVGCVVVILSCLVSLVEFLVGWPSRGPDLSPEPWRIIMTAVYFGALFVIMAYPTPQIHFLLPSHTDFWRLKPSERRIAGRKGQIRIMRETAFSVLLIGILIMVVWVVAGVLIRRLVL